MPRLEQFDQQRTPVASSGVPRVPSASTSGLSALGESFGEVGKFFAKRSLQEDTDNYQNILRDVQDVWLLESQRLIKEMPKNGKVEVEEGLPYVDETGVVRQQGPIKPLDKPVTHTQYVKDRYYKFLESKLEGQTDRVRNAVTAKANTFWAKLAATHSKAEVARTVRTSWENYEKDVDRTSNSMRRLPSKSELENLGYLKHDILDENIAARQQIDANDTRIPKEDIEERRINAQERYAGAYVERRIETDPEWILDELMKGRLDKYLNEKQLNHYLRAAQTEVSDRNKKNAEGLKFTLSSASENMISELKNKGITNTPQLTQEDFVTAFGADTGLIKYRRHLIDSAKASSEYHITDMFSRMDYADMTAAIAIQRKAVANAKGENNEIEAYKLDRMIELQSKAEKLVETDPATLGRSGNIYQKVNNTPMTDSDRKRALDRASLMNQARNGVSNPKILTNKEASTLAGWLKSGSLHAENGLITAERALEETFEQHPDNKHLVIRQLVEDHNIHPHIEFLTGFENSVAKDYVRTLITQYSANPQDLYPVDSSGERSSDDKKAIEANVRKHMTPFQNSSQDDPTAAELGNNLGSRATDVVTQVAFLLKKENPNLTVEEAAKKAYDDTIGAQYQFIEWNDGKYIRVPLRLEGSKGITGDVVSVENPHASHVFEAGIENWISSLKPEDILLTSDPSLKLTDEEMKKAAERLFMSPRDIQRARIRDLVGEPPKGIGDVVSQSFGMLDISLERMVDDAEALAQTLTSGLHTPLTDRPNLEVRLSGDERYMELWGKELNKPAKPLYDNNGVKIRKSVLDLKFDGDKKLYENGDHPAEGNAFIRLFSWSTEETIKESIEESREGVDAAKGNTKIPVKRIAPGSNFYDMELSSQNPNNSLGLADDLILEDIRKRTKKSKDK